VGNSLIGLLNPIHPKLVHFPIAFFITAFVLDILSWILDKEKLHESAVVMYVIAAFSTPIVVLAGLWEQWRLHLNHPVLAQHKLYAFATMWVSLVSLPVLWSLKKVSLRIFRIVFTCLLLCLSILVTTAGYWGGKMVYEYGAGVSQ
jgi:uncharacterized membrane protein